MSTASTSVEIEYPESDGKPMGETDLHIDWLFRLRDMFKYRYRGQQVYVAADLLLYYEEGNPQKVVVPDLFVVKDCDPGMRRVYKTWEEPSPNFVIEITSFSSKRRDSVSKPSIYARLGIQEYFVFDPTQDYLNPPLRGYRLQGDSHVPIELDAVGWLWSKELDIKCRIDGDELVLADGQTGEPLLPRWAAEKRAREEEQRTREAAQRAHEEEQRAREAAEAEVERLREELRQLQSDE